MTETIKDSKDYGQSYRNMVETRKLRHGEDTYAEAGRKSTYHGFNDPKTRKLANLKRWHKEYFQNGELKPEFKHLLEEEA